MKFRSILFSQAPFNEADIPPYFVDLNLDQVVETAIAGRQEYRLEPLYFQPLRDIAAIEYRHEVFRDLERDATLAQIHDFARGIRAVRSHLDRSARLHYRYQKGWWLASAVRTFCDTVRRLEEGLRPIDLDSRGLQGVREYLAGYVASQRYRFLAENSRQLLQELSSIRYSLLIKDSSVTVRRYAAELDQSAEVHETFAKFRQGAVKSYAVEFSESKEMNHVEAAVADRVAMLEPALFQRLEDFARTAGDFMDDAIGRFDREIQFYLSYLNLTASLKKLGLPFCYPSFTGEDRSIRSVEGFDLALAIKLAREGTRVVTNDFSLQGPERIFVVSGPNQGGKTTFARAFGQLHYLAALGCPVPGSEARLSLFDDLFTHFERQEDITNLRGKLHDDLLRMRDILDRATADSIVVLNEIFNSTTLSDEIFLSERVLRRVAELDCLAVCVTFIDELSRLDERTVSMMSTVAPDNPADRTFKVVRKEADGLAYAMAIAKRHRVTYAGLKERLAQ